MGIPVETYLLQMLHGLVYGMLLFLVTSGLTLVLGMMGVLNIAHGAFYMLGAYLAYTVTLACGSFWWSLLISPIIVGILGFLTERFLLRKTYRGGQHGQLMITFGLFFILTELIRAIWGSSPLPIQAPYLLAGNIPLLGSTYPIYRLFLLGISFLVLLGMVMLLTRTRIGIIIRASVTGANMVEALGTNVPMVITGVFTVGVMLASFAGVIASPFLSVHLGMAREILLDCFVIIVIGGIGSIAGAFVSSLMIGEVQSFGIFWIPSLALVLEFLLMIGVFIFRPTGLFGEKE